MNQQQIAPEDLLARQRELSPFSEVRQYVAEAHDRHLDDTIIDLENLKVAEDDREQGLRIEMPNLGCLAVTEHAKAQLGSKVGVSWDKWFDPKHIKPEEIQRELQRRFSRTRESCLIRAAQFAPTVKEPPKGCDGYIRGFLNPSYNPIDNERIFDQLEAQFGGFLEDMKFMRNHMGGSWEDDRTSHFSAMGQPVCLGEIDPENDGRGGRIYNMAQQEGLMPNGDWVYLGFHLRNSEVGYTALTVDQMLYRLICLNGYISSSKEDRVLYRKHVKIDDDGIAKILHEGFIKLEDVWSATRGRLTKLQETEVEEPKEEIRRFLRKQGASLTFTENAVDAWEKEPTKTRAGVMHAISRAAQDAEDMNKRFSLEGLAGKYLATA